MRRKRRIWLGKISRSDRDPRQLALVHRDFPADIEKALDPDRRHSYYGREWRLSQPIVTADGFLYCKLGFAKRARAEEVDYIEAEHEWVTIDAPAKTGTYSHFVVNLHSQLVAFEEKSVDLSRQSFLNALSLFVRQVGYEVEAVSDAAGFEAWLDDVDQVTRFQVALRRPNPRFSPRARETREIAEAIGADRLSIEATSTNGVNVRGTFLEGAAETAALGNGEFRASGLKGRARRFFDSTKRFLGGDIEINDYDSSGAIVAKMRDLLAELEPAQDPENQEDGDGDGSA